MENRIQAAKGERLRRLEEGLGHAEKLFLQNVWWPAIGHFRYLEPEYEVRDFKDGSRFVDFAYLRPPFRACFEIDGYGPHWRDVNRWKFPDHLMRQNHLLLDGWKVIRFAYDDILEKPRRCQQIVWQLLGRFIGEQGQVDTLSYEEREVIRIAAKKQAAVSLTDIMQQMNVGEKYARKLLRRLADLNLIQPAAGGTSRVHAYRLALQNDDLFF
jgi:very-short-patch-repair endonuclease